MKKETKRREKTQSKYIEYPTFEDPFEEVAYYYENGILNNMAKALKASTDKIDELVSCVVLSVLEKDKDYLKEIFSKPRTNKKYTQGLQYIWGIMKNNLFFERTPFDKSYGSWNKRRRSLYELSSYKNEMMSNKKAELDDYDE